MTWSPVVAWLLTHVIGGKTTLVDPLAAREHRAKEQTRDPTSPVQACKVWRRRESFSGQNGNTAAAASVVNRKSGRIPNTTKYG